LAYEIDAAGNVQLEQDAGCGEVARIEVHPVFVRLLAEKLGMLGDASGSKQHAALVRRMCLLRDRIAVLHDMLISIRCYPPGSGDDSPENLYSESSLEMADEFCADFEPDTPEHLEATPGGAAGRHIGIDRTDRLQDGAAAQGSLELAGAGS
jgi:hypothetical protein